LWKGSIVCVRSPLYVLFDGNEKEREMSATANPPASGTTPGRVEGRLGVLLFDAGGRSAATEEVS
jgi:hypothetical protein